MDQLTIKYIPLHKDFKEPKKAYQEDGWEDACFDLVATSIDDLGDGRVIYGLGFSCELPKGYFLDLRPRSSIHKTGMMLTNPPGTGDPNYRGEYMAVFYNFIPSLPNYKVGDKVVQCRLSKMEGEVWEKTDSLTETSRGDKGYGSSGE